MNNKIADYSVKWSSGTRSWFANHLVLHSMGSNLISGNNLNFFEKINCKPTSAKTDVGTKLC